MSLVRRRAGGVGFLRSAGSLARRVAPYARTAGKLIRHARNSYRNRNRGSRRRNKNKTRKGYRRAPYIGGSGVTSYVRLSLLGRKQQFLNKVQYHLSNKLRYEVLNKIRVSNIQNYQASTWLTMFDGAELRDASDRTTGGTYSAGFSLYIRSCKLRMQIVNVQNIMTTIWIYECVLRRDINVGDLDARVDWQEGIDAQGGDDTDFERPYSTPFTSRRFCTKWRVAKVTRAIVSPGETHVHYVHANVKHKLSSERYTNFDDGDGTGTVGIGGLSTCVMLVGLGGVWNDVTTKSAIGYSPVALDVAYTKKYDFMGTINDRKNYYVSNHLSTVTTGQLLEEVDASPEPLKTA